MARPQSRVPRGRGDAGPYMKVLLTGASSFTGYWFAHALHAAGAHVVAPLRAAAASYAEGTRAERVRRLGRRRRGRGRGAVRLGALPGSCEVRRLRPSLPSRGAGRRLSQPGFRHRRRARRKHRQSARGSRDALGKGGLKGVVLTGSVFEQDEGAGEAAARRLLALRPVEGPDRGGRQPPLPRGRTAASPNSSSPTRSARSRSRVSAPTSSEPGRRARPRGSTRRLTCATTSMSRFWRRPMPSLRPRRSAGTGACEAQSERLCRSAGRLRRAIRRRHAAAARTGLRARTRRPDRFF